MKSQHSPDTSGRSMITLADVDESAESFELLNRSLRSDPKASYDCRLVISEILRLTINHSQHSQSSPSHTSTIGRRISDQGWILLLGISAIVPIALGLVFLLSLGLNAPHGITSGHTFTRPVEEGLSVSIGKRHMSLSPLLISSVASSIIGDLGILAMSLVAFQVAYLWLQVSRSDSSSIPPPYQFFLISDIISHSSPFALVRFLAYVIRRRGYTTSKDSGQREPIVLMLWITATVALVLLMLSSTIKVLDIVLHDQLRSSLLHQNISTTVLGDAFVSPSCSLADFNSCAPLPRAQEANMGGQNQSATFGVYPLPYNPASNLSYAFVGSTEPDTSVVLSGRTVALGTECAMFYPNCTYLVSSLGYNLECTAIDDPYYTLSSPTFLVNNNDPIIMLQDSRMLDDANYIGQIQNPLWIYGFMCVDYWQGVYSGYNESNRRVFAPYFFMGTNTDNATTDNWPGIYCFIYDCWSTVYDGTYTISHGVAELDQSSLVPASPETVLAISSSVPVYVWTGAYATIPHYLDSAVQVDINTAANLYFNDTTRFSAALAQSLSNRMLGWSSGAITMNETAANRTVDILAVSIPLVTASAITGLHFFYACLVLALAATSIFLPTEYHTSVPLNGDGRYVGFGADDSEEEKLSRSSSPQPHTSILLPIPSTQTLVSDLVVAQRKLSDTSTLVHEIVIRHDQLSAIDNRALLTSDGPIKGSSALVRPASSHSTPVPTSALPPSLNETNLSWGTGGDDTEVDFPAPLSLRSAPMSPSELDSAATDGNRMPLMTSATSTARARGAFLSSSGSMNDLKDVERNDVGEVVRVGIVPDEDGPLRLRILHQN